MREKQKEAKKNLHFSLFLPIFSLRCAYFTFRGAHQKPLTSYDPWRDELPKRDGRFLWPFSHGSRACSRDGDCVAEMFFSLLYSYLICYVLTNLGCKSTHFF
jgi:hypothetical protein